MLFVLGIKGQCLLDVGPDQYACSGYGVTGENYLGTNIQIQNGVPPYSFTWEAHLVVTIGSITNHLHASDFLDDTTQLNPQYLNPLEDLQFTLTVTDSMGNQCKDSLFVYLSQFNSHLTSISKTIWKGDSAFLDFTPKLFGGIGSLKYLWKPNHGLRDSTSARGFWAKPDSTIAYYLTVEDSVGCTAIAPPLFFVKVNHINLNENSVSPRISIYPNPASEFIKFKLKNEHDFTILRMVNLLGKRVYAPLNSQKEMDVSNLPNGIYIISLEVDGEVFYSKFEKR